MTGRYRVGCAGMFVLGTDYAMDDEHEAIVACEQGPPGCEVFDTVTGEALGPTCQEDIDYAKGVLASRAKPCPTCGGELGTLACSDCAAPLPTTRTEQ